jgi:hypothetical protein
MVAAPHLVESAIFIAYITFAVTALGAIVATIAYTRIAKPGRLVLIDMPQGGVPLNETPPQDWPDVIPVEPGRDHDDLRVVKVELKTTGRWDVASSAFDQGLPITIDVGAPILKMEINRPPDTPYLKAEIADTKLKIGPALLRRRLTWTFILLTNGPAALAIVNPLIDVNILRNSQQKRRRRKYLALTIVLYVIIVASSPSARGAQAGLIYQLSSGIAAFLGNFYH